MGGARHAGAARPRGRASARAVGGGALSLWRRAGASLLILSAAGGGACGTFGPDLTQVIQISVVVATSVAVTDTLHARASALTAGGDTVPATFYWASFDTTMLAVADSMAGVFVGRRVGTTSLQARTDSLRSDPIRITVTASTTP